MTMATRNPPAEAWWETALAFTGLLMSIAALLIAWVLIDAAHEPTERCFDATTTESAYCRTQHWE